VWGLAASTRRIRRACNVTTAALSQRLAAIGHPIADTGITKTEKGDRRVDADDLVALALALGVTPNTLLMPQVDYLGASGTHYLTPEAIGTAEELWQWAQGERPPLILAEDALSWLGGGEHPMVGFAVRNRPYLTAPRPPTAENAEADPALRELASAVVKAMNAGAGASEVRRAVELTIALPVILVTPEVREQLRKGRGGEGA
jgi:transcriptional regulator with XRE-family HTH domain